MTALRLFGTMAILIILQTVFNVRAADDAIEQPAELLAKLNAFSYTIPAEFDMGSFKLLTDEILQYQLTDTGIRRQEIWHITLLFQVINKCNEIKAIMTRDYVKPYIRNLQTDSLRKSLLAYPPPGDGTPEEKYQRMVSYNESKLIVLAHEQDLLRITSTCMFTAKVRMEEYFSSAEIENQILPLALSLCNTKEQYFKLKAGIDEVLERRKKYEEAGRAHNGSSRETTWAIPWSFRVGSGPGKVFATVHHGETIDATGKITISKGGTSVSADLNDPTSSY